MFFSKNGPNLRDKFQNRQEAGFLLSQELKKIKLGNNLVICAIPRGGVVIGAEIARELRATLTVLPVKKIAAPYNPELAIGAIGPWGKPAFDKSLISTLQISKDELKKEVKKARDEVKRRMVDYDIKRPNFGGKIVILTDDGVATGATMNLAAKTIKPFGPIKLVLAVPVAPKSKLSEFKKIFDEVMVLLTPADFRAVGQFYYDFPQVTDEEVKQLLKETKVPKEINGTKGKL